MEMASSEAPKGDTSHNYQGFEFDVLRLSI